MILSVFLLFFLLYLPSIDALAHFHFNSVPTLEFFIIIFYFRASLNSFGVHNNNIRSCDTNARTRTMSVNWGITSSGKFFSFAQRSYVNGKRFESVRKLLQQLKTKSMKKKSSACAHHKEWKWVPCRLISKEIIKLSYTYLFYFAASPALAGSERSTHISASSQTHSLDIQGSYLLVCMHARISLYLAN